MKFTCVIPSLLAPYPNAAKNRDNKIFRAIGSVFKQTFKDYEIIVVAHGCQKTMDLLRGMEVRTFLIPKSPLWSGEPRNKGIEEAEGEYIVYLDIDDIWGENHLSGISEQLGEGDWVWFDDIRYMPKSGRWYQNPCDITKIGRHGTSNICHKKALPVRWKHSGYAHDFYFVQELRRYPSYKKIEGGEYYVAHLPGKGGYDL